MIITIDGPVATGKSTIAKKLAEQLSFIHFDTGAMYRCVTYATIKAKIDLNNIKALSQFLDLFTFDIKLIDGEPHYFIGHEEVTLAIRGEAVTKLVSKCAAIPIVRKKLVLLQREWAKGANAVFEGRDMGTVVFPDAPFKFFLIGNTEVRAKRRYDELRAKFPKESEKLTLEHMIEDINQRDHYDSMREVSPLKPAEDAIIIDTTNLTIDQVIKTIKAYIIP